MKVWRTHYGPLDAWDATPAYCVDAIEAAEEFVRMLTITDYKGLVEQDSIVNG